MLRLRNIPEGVRRWIPPASAAAAALIVFFPILGFDFLEYDDLIYVFESPLSGALTPASIAGAFLSPYFRSYSPLTLLTHALDLRLWGASGGMHHLWNLLLHAANVVLIHRIAVQLSGFARVRPPSGTATFAALAASMLFAVHPLQVEPVAWISGRKDMLMAFFLLASFILYLKWREGSGGHGGWYAALAISFVLALLSKSSAAAFPLVLVICDRLVFGRRDSWLSLVREKGVMLAAAGAALVVAFLAGKGHDTSDLLAGLPPAVRVLLPLFTPVLYLWELVWPSGLTPFTPPPSLPWIFIGAGVAVVITSVLIRNRLSGLLAVWGAYVLMLLPTIGGTFMETGMQPWADRFVYAPLVPVFVAAGAGLSRIPRYHARFAVLIAAVVGLGVVSRSQLSHWRNTETLWTRVVEASPAVAKGHKNLGAVRLRQGRREEAIRLLSQAVALKPADGEAWNNLGLALAAAGRHGEALGAHRTAIARDSSMAEGYNGYGTALLRTGDARAALEVFQRGIEAAPGVARLRYNAALAALALGDTSAAIERFQSAWSLDPTALHAAENAARLLDARGDSTAWAWYRRAADAGSADAREWLRIRGITRAEGTR